MYNTVGDNAPPVDVPRCPPGESQGTWYKWCFAPPGVFLPSPGVLGSWTPNTALGPPGVRACVPDRAGFLGPQGLRVRWAGIALVSGPVKHVALMSLAYLVTASQWITFLNVTRADGRSV